MSTAKELRAKSAADLQKELLELRREQFNLRMARATGQAAKPDQFTKVRRSIARLKTVVGEQRAKSDTGSAAAKPVAAPVAAKKVAGAKKAGAKKKVGKS
jgi:large subunit ribosomal protein L29